MANKKITELTEETNPQGADLLPLVDDVSGTPTTKKVTVTNLMTLAPQGDLEAANNLSDLNDAATARTNLGLGTAAITASTDYATAAHTHALDDLSDVSVSSPSSQDVVKWTGSQWEAGQVSVDVDTPLTTALRGTDNPHIGASPNQSFKVMDNPDKSAMVIADADGNVTYILKDSAAEVRVAKGASGTPSRFALASDLPAFVLENDTGEPDIEVTEPTSGEKISVISGDSDTKGANGLPTRQGYNLPDIGANPAPILISGGTIA